MNDRVPTRVEIDRALAGLKTHPSAIVRHRGHVLGRELLRLRQDNEHLRAEKMFTWRWINYRPVWRRLLDWIDRRTALPPTTEKTPDAT